MENCKMQLLRVKASSKEEFENAKSFGEVYGYATLYNEKMKPRIFSVYIELGQEKVLNQNTNIKSKTDCKKFLKCSVYAAKTDEQVDQGDFIICAEVEVVFFLH
jgi:hypothetical protein